MTSYTLAPTASRGSRFRSLFCEGCEIGAHEGRQIGRRPGGDEIAIAHHLAIHVGRPGIDHVILDREETGAPLALEHPRRGQDPWAVADGPHRMLVLEDLADKLDYRRRPSHVVRGIPARYNHAVELVGLDLRNGQIFGDFIAMFALVRG